MKKIITTLILLIGLALNVFAQQEVPMFFDNDLMLTTNHSGDRRIAYSPDSSKIAMGLNNYKIAIWDTATGREITRLVGHNN
jgi:WD40 repeat protein